MGKLNKYIIEAKNKGYFVDENGNVFSKKNRKRILSVNKGGYLRFSFRNNNNEVKNIEVHRLQAYQKFGDKIFKKGIQVRHLNNDKENNSWDNIGIGNQSQNMMDRPKEERLKHAKRAISFIKKHNHDDIKQFYENNDVSYLDIMKKFNISSKGTVSYIINK